jgi:light-regulated signal transduction histidine kinase (bacteriophytochrome)
MYFRNKNQKEKNQLLETKNKEITRQNEILASSNRDLEQYAYIISHDLKEPLRNISSFTNLLNRKLKNSITPDTQQYMDYILKGTQQMHDLLHDLLLYSKISRHKKDIKTIDTHDLLTQIFAQLNLEINENQAQVRLKVLPSVSFDKQQLKIIFTHLIKNALKFRREENPIIEIDYIENSDNHIFTVKDNGIGIEEKYYDRIFVIFQRIHDRGKYSGTSMGLATCKKILEEYKGNIWVTSIVNSGSTFYIQIPKK